MNGTLSEPPPYEVEACEGDDGACDEEVGVLGTRSDQKSVRALRNRVEPYLRRSIHPMTSLLRPSVLAVSNSRFCVPFKIFFWSMRLLRTSCP
jgi:hypothetical protein